MYESEVNGAQAPLEELPSDVRHRFAEFSGRVSRRSVIPWQEHCSECFRPHCYAKCEFYTPRPDLKCRRFDGGIVRVPHPEAPVVSLMKISFRKWGKLEGVGTVATYPTRVARALERWDEAVADLVRGTPLPFDLKARWTRFRAYRKNRRARAGASKDRVSPNCFVIECYNPSSRMVSATLTMRPKGARAHLPYQERCVFDPGFNRKVIKIEDIQAKINLRDDFLVQIEPTTNGEDVLLYFGLVDFVCVDTVDEAVATSAPASTEKARRAKCVIWDLDNTLWKGTLIEDGREKLELNEDAVRTIKALDERGILQSVVSKNNAADAAVILEHFGLTEYFLYPEISWGPKSVGVGRIAKNLNIGLDTLVFVDDQPFERAEVTNAYPEVRALDATVIPMLLDDPLFDVPVTRESRMRRRLYKEQIVRNEVLTDSGGDYEAFLRSCNLVLSIASLSEPALGRVHELAQRTNQMNFSGNRYTRQILANIMADSNLDTYVLGCRDRFGEYGIIGFAVIDRTQPIMKDLMFSCRIQSKRVEHAFLAHVLELYRERGCSAFRVRYKKTDKNAPAARVFWDLKFEEEGVDDGVSILKYDLSRPVPTDGVVAIESAP